MISVNRVDEVVSELSGVEGIVGSIWLITGVPSEYVRSVTEVFHLVVDRREVEETVPHVVLDVQP